MQDVSSKEKCFNVLSKWFDSSKLDTTIRVHYPFCSLDYAGMTSLLSAQTLGSYAANHQTPMYSLISSFGLFLMHSFCTYDALISEDKLRAYAHKVAEDFKVTLESDHVEYDYAEVPLDFSYVNMRNQQEGWCQEDSLTDYFYDYLIEFYQLFVKHNAALYKLMGRGLVSEHAEVESVKEFLKFFINKTPFIIYDQGPEFDRNLFYYFPITKMNDLFLPALKETYTMHDATEFFEQEVPQMYKRMVSSTFKKLAYGCIFLPGTTIPFREAFEDLTLPMENHDPFSQNPVELHMISYLPGARSLALVLLLKKEAWRELFGLTPNKMIRVPEFPFSALIP